MSSLFLSYRRADCPDSVSRLHDLLLRRLPLWSLFYDHRRIAPGEDFSDRLRQEVTSAKVVLVAIGPRWVETLAARRAGPGVDHVREEIRLALGAGRTIIPVLLDNARMPTEQDLAEWPDLWPLLRLNAIHVRPDPDFEADTERLASFLDSHGPSGVARLWKSHRRRVRSAILATLAFFVFVVLYALFSDVGLPLPGGEFARRRLDAHGLSLFRPVPSEDLLRARAEQVRSRCREILRTRQDTAGWFCRGLLKDRAPEHSVWTHNQAVAAELRERGSRPSLRPGLHRCLALPFDERHWPVVDDRKQPYGWLGYTGCPYTFLEPVLWFQIAASHALRGSTALAVADREALEARLQVLQEVVDRHRTTGSDGWNKFPNQTNPFEHDPYCSALGLVALLELRAASRGWRGDVELRERMTTGTVNYLVASHQAHGPTAGWSTSAVINHPIDGLTIMIYSVLLRAEAEAGTALPAPVVDAAARRVAELKTRTLTFPDATGQVIREFRDHTGNVRRVQESVNFPWYPWAVELTARMLDRMKRHGATPEELCEVRRALGNLVLDLSDGMLSRVEQGNTFLTSELLYCFSDWP